MTKLLVVEVKKIVAPPLLKKINIGLMPFVAARGSQAPKFPWRSCALLIRWRPGTPEWKDNFHVRFFPTFSQRIVSNVRSVRASYMLPNKTKTRLVLRCSDQEVILFKPWKYALGNNLIGFWQVVDMITHLAGNISTLAFCHSVSVSTDGGSTRGCAIVTVSDKCDAIVHL